MSEKIMYQRQEEKTDKTAAAPKETRYCRATQPGAGRWLMKDPALCNSRRAPGFSILTYTRRGLGESTDRVGPQCPHL